MNLQVGDTVYIKSEERMDASKKNYMTVVGFIKYDSNRFSSDDYIGVWQKGEIFVICVWFKENQEQIKKFNSKLLTKYV